MMINNKKRYIKTNFIFKKNLNQIIKLQILFAIVSTSVFLLIYFQTTIKFHGDPADSVLKGEMYIDWLTQVKPSFYTNFYFL